MTKSDSFSLSEARTGRPARVAGPSTVAANVSCRGRVVDDPDRRPAVDDQPDRDAEERDAVGVVDRAVERVDDPDPATAGGGRLARHRLMLAGLLGEDRVVREARPDGVEDERLGQVVGLGHDVPGALVVDLLEPLVVVHEDSPARAARAIAKASSAAYAPAGVGRHGPEQSTSRGADRRPELGHGLAERHGLAALDLGRQDERARDRRAIGRIGHPAGRLARAAALVGDRERDRQIRRRRRPAARSWPGTVRRRPARSWRRPPG